MPEIPTITFSNGRKMPMLGLGTYKSGKGEVGSAVKEAIDLGYRHIDTAYLYGNEKEIGQAVREKIRDGTVTREDLFITTKLWNTFHKEQLVVSSCKQSLASLGLEYIDLYLVHWPFALKDKVPKGTYPPIALIFCGVQLHLWCNMKSLEGFLPTLYTKKSVRGAEEGDDLLPQKDGKLIESDVDYLETWKGMEECARQGLTRSIGISNFNSQQITRLLESAKIAPVNNQVEVNINLNQEKLIDFCKKRNITVTGYCPLGQPGNQSGIGNRLDSSVVLQIAQKYNKTPAQVGLRYVFQQGVTVIPKSVTNSRIKENMEIFDFALTADEINAIRKLGTGERIANFDVVKDFKYFPFAIPF